MKKIQFLTLTLVSSLVLLLYTSLALKLHLFFVSPILDAPSHVMGGFVSALILAYVASIFREKKGIFIGVFIIGVLWEIFELYFGLTSLEKSGYWTDTIGDMICDLFGAFLAYFYFIRKLYARN